MDRIRTRMSCILVAAGAAGADAAPSVPGDTVPRLCLGAACSTTPAVFDRWDEAERLRYGYGMTARDDVALR